ncbi:unnamed protein product [Coffea canephora]|uniref:DH200=94 genomic scaffold, scaffold_1404 n=1 Tax=Coffea canephora TaxID=49390 RepID=A0A068VIR1_COFCA|nr:unnamed protein product [Coffea canephora]
MTSCAPQYENSILRNDSCPNFSSAGIGLSSRRVKLKDKRERFGGKSGGSILKPDPDSLSAVT